MGIKTNIVLRGGNPPIPMNILQGSSNHYPKNIVLDANKVYEMTDELRQQIGNITAYEVSVTVSSFSELSSYDTSTLTDGDIIKVESDETNNNSVAYYQWDAETSTYNMLGVNGIYYTKTETDKLIDEVKDGISNLTTQVTNIEQTIETNKPYVQQGTEIITIPN